MATPARVRTPGVNIESVSQASIKPLLKCLMSATGDKGLSEPMILCLLQMDETFPPGVEWSYKWCPAQRIKPNDTYIAKVRRSLKSIGCKKEDLGDGMVWCLPASKRNPQTPYVRKPPGQTVEQRNGKRTINQYTGKPWTEKEIVDAAVAWRTKYGKWPRHDDWNTATEENPTRSQRVLRGRWGTVMKTAKEQFEKQTK